MGLLAAFLAIGLIASLFFWCACILASRADKALDQWADQLAYGDHPHLPFIDCDAASPAPQVPGGEPFLPVAGDTPFIAGTAQHHARRAGGIADLLHKQAGIK